MHDTGPTCPTVAHGRWNRLVPVCIHCASLSALRLRDSVSFLPLPIGVDARLSSREISNQMYGKYGLMDYLFGTDQLWRQHRLKVIASGNGNIKKLSTTMKKD